MNFLYNIFIFPIEKFMGICLSALFSLTGNYGISLILLSIIINIILIPVYRLANKWQAVEKNIQDRMQGEIDSIKKYYTTGEKKYYQIKAVYRRYGYNPLYSLRVSLGFLIQIPFFFAAYHFLSNYQNLNRVPFLFIKDLGVPDRFLYGLNILPVVMTLLNVASTFIHSRNMTNSQKVQLHGLSILFLVVLYNMPSGLVIYWTMNNIISLIKNAVKVIKTQSRSVFKSMFTIKSLPEFLDGFILSQYTRYVIFAILFIVTNLLTFYLLDKYKDAGLGRFSIKASIVLLFIAIMIIAIGIAKSRAKSFHGFILTYFTILLITSIGAISVGRLIEVLGIIQRVTDFMLFFLPASVLILLYKFFKLLRDEHGIDISKPSLAVIKFDKRNFILTLILFNTIFFIWGPTLTVSSAGPNEFYISFIYILLWQLLFFLVSFAVFFAFYLVLPKTIKYLVTFTLQYLSVTAIIYLVFNKKDIGLMDNFILFVPDNLKMESNELLLEIFLLYFILFCLYFLLRHSVGLLNRVMSFLLIIIFLSSVYYSFIIFKNDKKEVVSLDKYELTLSKDRSNILIFFLDGFSGGAIKNLKDNNPELLNGLDGFTWYKNILTNATGGTRGAIAALYGGHKYSIKEINKNSINTLHDDFIEAFNFLNREFVRHGYIAKIVNPPVLTCNDIDSNTECYRAGSFSDSESKNKENPLLVNAVTTFKAIPHMFQDDVYDNGAWHGLAKKGIMDPHLQAKIKQWNLLLNLKDHVNVANDSTFNFISLTMPHGPNIMDSGCVFADDLNGTYLNEAYCAIKAIKQVIERMKELKVYNNTMIVLISDHGWLIKDPLFNEDVFFSTISAGDKNGLSPGILHPLLMVKDINARGNLDISKILLSNADLPSIVCTVIGSCEGIPADYRKYKGERVVTIDFYAPSDQGAEWFSERGYGHVRARYEVTDNIFDASNWKKIF